MDRGDINEHLAGAVPCLFQDQAEIRRAREQIALLQLSTFSTEQSNDQDPGKNDR
jgi:hypothetical protein